jgi:hypothetical protein
VGLLLYVGEDEVDRRHYVPILLTRQGERLALQNSGPALKDRFTPLFVVPHVVWDYEADDWAKSLDEHLADLPADLFQAWGPRPAFIDLLDVDDDGPLANGQHPLFWLTAACGVLGMPVLPVVAPDRTASYRAAVAAICTRDHRGACVRLPVETWPLNAPTALTLLLNELGLAPGDVDLVLDLGAQTGTLAITALRQQLGSLANLADWRSLVVCATAMPAQMPAGAGETIVARREWLGYRDLLTTAVAPARVPTFGDYAISNPDQIEMDPRIMSISATLRYTSADNWIIAKGRLFKGPGGTSLGGSAMVPVATTLQAHPGFLGAGHCGCEVWLQGVVSGTANGGTPMVWRRHGTLHHLTVVTGQLATLHAALPGP